jgi:uridine phosphorylase
VPVEYPAAADYRVTAALEEAASESGYADRHTGIILSSAVFFPGPFETIDNEKWSRAGVIGVEMEYAPLLVLASIHGAMAGGLFMADGNALDKKEVEDYNPDQDVVKRGKLAMIQIGLDALVKLAELI